MCFLVFPCHSKRKCCHRGTEQSEQGVTGRGGGGVRGGVRGGGGRSMISGGLGLKILVAKRQRAPPPHLQCYYLNFIMNKLNFQKIYEWKPKGAIVIFTKKIYIVFTNYNTRILYILLAVNRNTKCKYRIFWWMYSILLFWNYTVILRMFNQMENKVSTGFNIVNEYFLLSKINR